MRDDDDLPVLNAVVRGGDADVIRSMRLSSTLAGLASAEPVSRKARARRERRDVTRLDVGHAPVDIDASRDRDGRRASRLVADVRAALDIALDGALDDVLPDRTTAPADGGHDLDDTLPLGRGRIAAPDDGDDGACAMNPGRTGGAHAANVGEDVDVDALVERIVDRHVAALRRDVRDALEHALGHAPEHALAPTGGRP